MQKIFSRKLEAAGGKHTLSKKWETTDPERRIFKASFPIKAGESTRWITLKIIQDTQEDYNLIVAMSHHVRPGISEHRLSEKAVELLADEDKENLAHIIDRFIRDD